MAGEESGAQQSGVRTTENDLLVQAASVMQARYDKGIGYADLPPSSASELSDVLTRIATVDDGPDQIHREEAVALAHRIIDDDHPQLSPMWPHPSA